MVKSHKAFLLSVLRLFKEQIGRFLSLLLIATIGVGFISGLGPIKAKLEDSVSDSFKEKKVPDLVGISSNSVGFTTAELEDINDSSYVRESQSYFFLEKEKSDGSIYRVYSQNLSSKALGKMTLVEGKLPNDKKEVVVEKETAKLKKFNVGDKVTLSLPLAYSLTGVSDLDYEVTVTGIVNNPLFSYLEEAISYSDEDKDLEAVYYFNQDSSPFPSSYVNGVNILLSSTSKDNIYSDDYVKKVKKAKDSLLTSLNNKDISFLTLEENEGAKALGSYAQKVANITIFLSIFFIAIVALVIGNTLARLVEEERNQIACYKSLGFKDGPIFLKYESFAFISVAGGAFIGHYVISNVLTTIIYNAFSLSFSMPAMTSYTSPLWGFLGLALAIVVSIVTTFIVLKNYLREKPASLLKPKSPKAGKSLLIEKSKHLWKKIPFSWKSTIRNLFRNKPRLLMTVLTVSGSVALEVAAFGILASARANNDGSTALLSSISILLLVCSLALSVLVIYNLTNISLSERKRDLATLMVLGYRNHEVSSYIYREITIMVIFGIIIGLPLGVGFTAIVFNYVDFGSIADLSWQYYLIVATLELLTSVLVDLLLYPRIIRIDMNASLKAIE
jgi:putative ABC transport system permease protein